MRVKVWYEALTLVHGPGASISILFDLSNLKLDDAGDDWFSIPLGADYSIEDDLLGRVLWSQWVSLV